MSLNPRLIVLREVEKDLVANEDLNIITDKYLTKWAK